MTKKTDPADDHEWQLARAGVLLAEFERATGTKAQSTAEVYRWVATLSTEQQAALRGRMSDTETVEPHTHVMCGRATEWQEAQDDVLRKEFRLATGLAAKSVEEAEQWFMSLSLAERDRVGRRLNDPDVVGWYLQTPRTH